MIPISYCRRYTCDYVWSTVVVTYIPRILLIKSWKVKVQSIWEFKKRWCSHTQHSSPQRNNNLVFTDDISITGGSIVLWNCILCPLFTSKTVSNMIQWSTSDGIFNQFLGLMMLASALWISFLQLVGDTQIQDSHWFTLYPNKNLEFWNKWILIYRLLLF